jgi:hypothetical protein
MKPFIPSYKREHQMNPTGTEQTYTPPNFLLNGDFNKKTKGQFSEWQPPKGSLNTNLSQSK